MRERVSMYTAEAFVTACSGTETFSGDSGSTSTADSMALHRAVYSSCANGALISLLDQLWDRTDRYRLILVREELMDGPTSRQQHIDIADAIAARRADLSAPLMRAHIERSHIRIATTRMARATDGADLRAAGP